MRTLSLREGGVSAMVAFRSTWLVWPLGTILQAGEMRTSSLHPGRLATHR